MSKRNYPVDPDWEGMPEVGLEKWPDYDTDAAAWAEHQAAAIRTRQADRLDWSHLSDEVLDVSRAERRELSYRVSALLASLARQLLSACFDAAVCLPEPVEVPDGSRLAFAVLV